MSLFRFLLLAASSPALQAGMLVSFSFDDGLTDTGPDTFQVFESSRGSVNLDASFPWSGYHSVAIVDHAEDGDFPELQGRFPMQDGGRLQIHFAFMTPAPLETFNIALAGPEWFRLHRDGIGFWLKNRDGDLFHVSDSMPKRLFTLEPFTWYLVDADYDIDDGTYDLVVRSEYRDEPLVHLRQADNAARAPGSRVSVFSFIGDLADQSGGTLYVDDILIDSDRLPAPGQLVAPGRRKLFVDYWRELQHRRRAQPECLPLRELADAGIDTTLLQQVADAGQLEALQAAIDGAHQDEPVTLLPAVQALRHWNSGCMLLGDGKPWQAREHFESAVHGMPGAPLYSLSLALALAASGDFDGADYQLSHAYEVWYDDARMAAAQAMVAIARNDHWSAEAILRRLDMEHAELPGNVFPRLWNQPLTSGSREAVRLALPERWQGAVRQRLITEQFYFLLLWREGYPEALEFARGVAAFLEQQGINPGIWHEYQGNAALLMGDHDSALEAYQAALAARPERPGGVYLKLSDIFYLLGDFDSERYYRELVYGNLGGG